jgi:hypothetical protein
MVSSVSHVPCSVPFSWNALPRIEAPARESFAACATPRFAGCTFASRWVSCCFCLLCHKCPAPQVYCHSRGFMASYHAGYDHSRGARLMLMDYMNGKLLYCVPPPTQPSLNLYQDILDEAAASGLDTSLPATTASVTASVAASGKVNNVLAVPDTSALFHIPVPKHKSEKVSVKLSRHKARKGERDPDPYGTQAQADPLSAMLAEDAELGMMAAADAAKRRDDAVTKQVIGTGKGRANASTFTRVHRPYSEV